ncbi:MAG: hypothetical protein P8I97_00540 [Verrucomicrobiales bacterium]|nr:hypothetical protein [Verrucomicrobiales bacterium]
MHGLRVRCTALRCRNQGAVHLGSLQRCRNQGAVRPAKVQEAGCGARVKGAVHVAACKGAGSSDQGFSLISLTGLPPKVLPQPFAWALR